MFDGTVAEIVYQGESTLLYVDLPDGSRGRDPPARDSVGRSVAGRRARRHARLAARRHDARARRDAAMTAISLAGEDAPARPTRLARHRTPPSSGGRSAARRRMLAAWRVPGLLLIGVVALAPIAWLFWLSFRDADGLHARALRAPAAPDLPLTLRSTFELSFLVTVICIAARLSARLPHRRRRARGSRRSCCCWCCFRSGRRCWCAATRGSCCCSGAG